MEVEIYEELGRDRDTRAAEIFEERLQVLL